MTDLLPSSRFRLLDKPFLNPGKCAVCGNVETPIIDFGLDIKFYGAVMICTNCLKEAARGVGMVPETELTDNKKATDQIVGEYLDSHNLRVITYEQYRTVVSAVAGLSEFADSDLPDLPVEDSATSTQDDKSDFEQLRLFDVDDEGNVVTDDKSPGGEGTDGVLDSSILDLN